MRKQLITAIRITLVLLLIVSGAYPLIVWAIGQAAFNHQANGSLIHDLSGKIVGSELLAQSFAKPQYFAPRPSAAGNGYDPTQSGGTNLGPTSDKLINGIPDTLPNGKPNPSGFDGVKELAAEYRTTNGLAANAPVPVDAVTRSASGLDPHITPANADLQSARVAKARGISIDDIKPLIAQNTAGRGFGFLGEPAVNVLTLNIALDKEYPVKATSAK